MAKGAFFLIRIGLSARNALISGEKTNAVQPLTLPSRQAFLPPATNWLFRLDQEISQHARNRHCLPAWPRSKRQFVAVPTPPRKSLPALATPVLRRLGDRVKKRKSTHSSHFSAPVH